MRTDDLIITIAYFSIPTQIIVSLYRYPRLHYMPWHILLLAVLFALFVFLCGAGHLLKCLGRTDTAAYMAVNTVTAVVSLSTALYLLPITSYLMSSLDHNIQELVKLNEETEASKRKLMTFMAFLCHEIRNPLFIITSTISFLEDPDEVEEGFSMSLIKQSADLMLRLVNDVLDISRLESGKFELEKHDFDLHRTFEGATTSARAHLLQRHGSAKKEDGSGSPIVEFHTQVDPGVPRMAHGDQVRVLQVCLNLLSNAVKFTEKGFIDFRVSVCDYGEALENGHVSHTSSATMDFVKTCTDSEDTGDYATLLDDAESGNLEKRKRLFANSEFTVLKIRVEDSGCGIPPEQTSRIFRPYSMAKLAEYRQQGGTGLGLAIVSKLASMMNGTVNVRSSVGIGSVFEAYVVVERASLAESFAENAELVKPSQPDLLDSPSNESARRGNFLTLPQSVRTERSNDIVQISPRRSSSLPRQTLTKFDHPIGDAVVLVVDDNAMNRKLMTQMLRSFNLEFQEACNGQEAVDVMLRSRNKTGNQDDPRIVFVLMDLSMPVMGGCEATKLIRENGIDVPILVLTAAAIEEGRDGVMEAGATDYATKPILREELNLKCVRFIPR